MKKKRIIIAVITLLILIPLGLLTKFYSGSGEGWINNHLGGLFYVAFFTLLVYTLIHFWQSTQAWVPAIIALSVTITLEFLQLYTHPILEYLRSSFMGRSLIGSSFNETDFLYYFLGAFLGYFICFLINRKYEFKKKTD